MDHCTLCSGIQTAFAAEESAFDLLHEAADATGYRLLPPQAGEGISEDEWMEFACRRDDYERVRAKRLRIDNRFFAVCPRCHFDLAAARRRLEELRAGMPWWRGERVDVERRVRATGS